MGSVVRTVIVTFSHDRTVIVTFSHDDACEGDTLLPLSLEVLGHESPWWWGTSRLGGGALAGQALLPAARHELVDVIHTSWPILGMRDRNFPMVVVVSGYRKMLHGSSWQLHA